MDRDQFEYAICMGFNQSFQKAKFNVLFLISQLILSLDPHPPNHISIKSLSGQTPHPQDLDIVRSVSGNLYVFTGKMSVKQAIILG